MTPLRTGVRLRGEVLFCTILLNYRKSSWLNLPYGLPVTYSMYKLPLHLYIGIVIVNFNFYLQFLSSIIVYSCRDDWELNGYNGYNLTEDKARPGAEEAKVTMFSMF
jgi:hypothetical protein